MTKTKGFSENWGSYCLAEQRRGRGAVSSPRDPASARACPQSGCGSSADVSTHRGERALRAVGGARAARVAVEGYNVGLRFRLQELLSRTSLETQKLDLLTEVSELKLKLVGMEKEQREQEEKQKKAEVSGRHHVLGGPVLSEAPIGRSSRVWPWAA